MTMTPQDENPYASPLSEEAVGDLCPTQTWRDGDLVVVAGDGELPRQCLKCGSSVPTATLHNRRRLRKVTLPRRQLVHHLVVLGIALFPLFGGAVFFGRGIQGIQTITSLTNAVAPVFAIGLGLVLMSLFFYLMRRLEHLQKSREMRVLIGVFRCERHRRRLSLLRTLSYLILVSGFGISSIYLASPEIIIFRIIPAVLGAVYVNSMIYANLSGGLRLVRQANGHSWLSGFGKPFVDSLPPYPHAAERSSPAIVK